MISSGTKKHGLEGTLTSQVVDPHRSSKQINVVYKNKYVGSLIHHERVPRLGSICWVPSDCQPKTELRCNDRNSCADCNPGENIRCSTPVRLLRISNSQP